MLPLLRRRERLPVECIPSQGETRSSEEGVQAGSMARVRKQHPLEVAHGLHLSTQWHRANGRPSIQFGVCKFQ